MNADSVVVAESMEQLHSDANNLSKETGTVINGRGDEPNRHDILTGSTCEDWTSSSGGSAIVDHHDRMGGRANATSWNASYETLGCSLDALRKSGGDGLLYCFATN